MQPNINFARQRVLSSVKNWLPWALLILGIGLIVIIIGVMSRLKSMMISANSYASNTPGPNMPPVGASGAGSVMGHPATGGMGSGMMGSLATGAAMGAGAVAGEALMNHFIGGNKNNVVFAPPSEDTTLWNTSSNMSETDDMGGTDFSITNSSSWDDDETSDGGGDWT
jgi:uncharacterized protein